MVFKVYSDGSGMTGGPAGIGFVAYVDGELLLKGNLVVTAERGLAANRPAAARGRAPRVMGQVPVGRVDHLHARPRPPRQRKDAHARRPVWDSKVAGLSDGRS